MKKRFLNAIYLVVALGALTIVQSCKKDDAGSHVFYATIQQYRGDKVHIEEPYSCWDVNDQVRLHGWTGTIGLEQREGSNRFYINFGDVNVVHIGQTGGNTHGNGIMAAIYPIYLWGSSAFEAEDNNHNPATNLIHLEPTQKYETTANGYQKILAPMAAVLQSADNYELPYPENTLEFKNVCALLKVNVSTNTDIVVTRIEVENTGIGNGVRHSGRPLWGNYEITFDPSNEWLPILQEQSDITEDLAAKYITKEVTLECEHHGDLGGVEVSGGTTHPFYIYLPPVGYDALHVTVYAKMDDGNNGVIEKCITRISENSGTFLANTIYPLTVSYNSNNDNWTTVPRAHDLGPFTVSPSGKRVNFTFSNLHNDGDGYFFPPYQYDFIGFHDPNGDHDHFTNAQHVALLGADGYATQNGWTMLTGDEWNYMMGTSTDPTYKRSGDYLFACALVASVPGIILFPDNYPANYPTGAVPPTFNDLNTIQGDYRENTLNIPKFYELEQAGCVFLPCVWFNSGDATSISDVGHYWEKASWVTRTLYAGSNTGNYDGSSALIRLVKEINSSTSK